MSLNTNFNTNYSNFQVGEPGEVNTIPPTLGEDPRSTDTANKSTQTAKPNSFTAPGSPQLPAPSEAAQKDPTLLTNGLFQPQALLSHLQTQAQTNANNQNSNTQPLTDEGQRTLYANNFNAALTSYAKANNLSSSDVAKLTFAFYNSTATTEGTKLSSGADLNQILQTLTGQAQQETLKAGVDVSKLNPAVDSSSYNLSLSDAYNAAFEKAVNSDTSLSPEDKAALIYQHYNPSPALKGVDQNKLKQLQNAALKQTSQKFSTPAGWKPPLNNAMYNGALKGSFQVNLKLNLDEYAGQNNLNATELAALKKAIENIKDPSIPSALKAIAQQIINKTISETKVQNQLPVNWQPSAEQMKNAFKDISSNLATTSLVQAREMLNTSMAQLQLLMPNGPGKQKTIDLLMTISKAIVEAQNTIYEIQTSRSQQAKQQATAKLGMQLQQVREQQEKEKEMQKQQGKSGFLGVLMKIIEPVIKVITVLMAVATGGLLGLVFAILDSTLNLTGKLIEAIVDIVSKLIDKIIPSGNGFLDGLKAGLRAITQLFVMATMAIMAVGMLGPQLVTTMFTTMLTESDIIPDFCQMCGISREHAQYIAMAVGMAITITIGILSCINPAAAVPAVTQATARAAASTAKILKQVMDVIQKAVDLVNSVKILSKAISVTGKIVKKALQELSEVVNVIGSVAKRIADTTFRVLGNVLSKILKSAKGAKALELIEKLLTKALKNPNTFNRILAGISITQSTLTAVKSGIQGGMNVSQAIIASVRGKYDAIIEELQAMIKQLQKVLDDLLDSLSGLGEDLLSVKGLHDNLLKGLQDTLQKTTSIQIN